MTEHGDPERDGVNLGKDTGSHPGTGNAAGGSQPAEQPFDPYRFGRPDHPIPAEYAPPGYTGPTLPTNPYAGGPYAGGPYAGGPPQGQPYGEQPAGQQPGRDPYGRPQYPPYGYGAPTPPPYHGYAQPGTGHGKAIAALVLGILSIVFCWASFFDAIFVILGLIFSLIALSEARARRVGGRGLALAGLICTVVGALLATAFTVWVVHVANQCGGFGNSNDPGWNQCVRDHL
jgi:hypothetical protein